MTEEIAEMFADLDGTARYHEQLEIVFAWKRVERNEIVADRVRFSRRVSPPSAEQRAKAVERTRAWRKANPDKHRVLRRRANKAWRKKHPDKARARKRRYVAANRDHMREVWKRNSAAYRARKAARL